jgi:hypothetical protein
LSEVEALRQATCANGAEPGGPPVQLVIRSVERYRLVWDVEDRRHAVDVTLLLNNAGFVISHPVTRPPASSGKGKDARTTWEDELDPIGADDGWCGPLSEIAGWDEVVGGLVASLRESGAQRSGKEPKKDAASPVASTLARVAEDGHGAVPAPRTPRFVDTNASEKEDNGKAAGSAERARGQGGAGSSGKSKTVGLAVRPLVLDAGRSALVPREMVAQAVRRVTREVEGALRRAAGGERAGVKAEKN